MWAYFIMATYNLITGGPMGMFKNSTKETKEFEKIILEIEKERDTISWADTTIQSCLWNLENPKADRFTIDWCVRDLRENLNKKEEANAKLQYLKYTKLRQQMFMLHMTTNPDRFLEDLDRLKKEKEGKKLLFFEKIGDSKTSKEERLKNLVRILEKQGFKIKK